VKQQAPDDRGLHFAIRGIHNLRTGAGELPEHAPAERTQRAG